MPTEKRARYKYPEETKTKISQAISELSKSLAARDSFSENSGDSDCKCLLRFLELCEDYPEHQEFLYKNQSELLFAMRSIKSESELRYIRKYLENTSLEGGPSFSASYQYESSSYYAQEDATIELIDAICFLRRITGNADSSLTHLI